MSNLGRIRSLDRHDTKGRKLNGKVLKLIEGNKGYLQICIYKEGKSKLFSVHRLIAKAFIPNPNNLPYVGHKDDEKHNNDVTNLYWTDAKENNTHNGRHLIVAREVLQYDLNNNFLKSFKSIYEMNRQLGYCKSSIFRCCSGQRKKSHGFIWKYATSNNKDQIEIKGVSK